MTVGLSRVTDLNSYFNNIYEDAVFALRETNLATRLVRTFTDGQGDQTRSLTEYPTITPVSVAETEDFTAPTQFNKSLLSTLTPAEAMSQAIITDRRLETDPQNARQDASVELAAGFSEYVDDALFGDISSLTGGTVGAAGSTMTWGYFAAAVSIMRANKVPPPWYAVLHPYQYHYMAETASVGATVTNSPQFQDEVMGRWYAGTIYGVPVFLSANVTVDSEDDAYGGIFAPMALAFDLRRDFRLEPERDASKRAWELNATMLYAHGVWRPTWGVQIIADAQTVS